MNLPTVSKATIDAFIEEKERVADGLGIFACDEMPKLFEQQPELFEFLKQWIDRHSDTKLGKGTALMSCLFLYHLIERTSDIAKLEEVD